VAQEGLTWVWGAWGLERPLIPILCRHGAGQVATRTFSRRKVKRLDNSNAGCNTRGIHPALDLQGGVSCDVGSSFFPCS